MATQTVTEPANCPLEYILPFLLFIKEPSEFERHMATQLETVFPRSLAVLGGPLTKFWTRDESSILLLNYSLSPFFFFCNYVNF